MKQTDPNQNIYIANYWKWTLILIVMIISAGCGNSVDVQKNITATPTELESTESIEIQQQSLPKVVEACDVGAQETALIQDKIPDWSTLSVNACYQLWLQIKDDPREYVGKAIITFNNTFGEALDELVFRLYPNADRVYGGSLEVSSATISGNPTQLDVFLEDDTGLRLRLDEPIQPGETVLVELDFIGRLTDGFEDAPGTYGIFNYSQEADVATYINWYPILALRDEDGWQADPVIGIGDANGDGKDDLFLQYSKDGLNRWQVRLSTGSSFESNGD